MRLLRLLVLIALPALAGQARAQAPRDVTILYTNDFHSALDPIGAYWLPRNPRLGGAAALAGYVDRIRATDSTVFLFDSGDMFTGMVSNLTDGEALMELMRTMRYDAMAIGNHEFDYGAANFTRQMNRVPFPVLGANIFYKGTSHPYSRPWVILVRNGIRLGVIGFIGEDARSVANQAGITELDFADPVTVLAPIVAELRPQVDLIVVLAHQGQTGPQQTDAEAHPDVQRDFDEDIRVAGAVPGIDVFVGGHAHRGIETPYVDPRTGTIIVQTYGYGTRLGVLRLQLDGGKVVAHQGELLKVWSDSIPGDTAVARVVAHYQAAIASRAGAPLFTLARRVYRSYNAESPLGNAVADAMREEMGAEIGLQNAGGIRADLPEGPLTSGNVVDVLPFLNTVDAYRMTGAQLREIIEQSLTLARGMMQVSGMEVEYDLSRPEGERARRITVAGAPLDPARSYVVATASFLGAGGDLYQTFTRTEKLRTGRTITTVFEDWLRRKEPEAIAPPPDWKPTRLLPVSGDRTLIPSPA